MASELPAVAPKGEVTEVESALHPLVPPTNDAAEEPPSRYGNLASLRRVRAEALEVFDTRLLSGEDYVALWMDAIEVWGRKLLLCMGVTARGRKHMLGVVEGRMYNPATARSAVFQIQLVNR